MNSRLAEALNLLSIDEVNIDATTRISAKEHAKALFSYLHLGNYLSPKAIDTAITYLATAKPFAQDTASVIADLNQARSAAEKGGKFDATIFIAQFAQQDYFTVNDIIDIITFIQQTAFDRNFGVERDCLPRKVWLEENPKAFYALAKHLNIIAEQPPKAAHYHAVCIMGGASSRVTKRLDYFRQMPSIYDFVCALSGDRELSIGLDDVTVMAAVAQSVGKPVKYVERVTGAAPPRQCLEGVTETMMVNFMLNAVGNSKISVIDSGIQAGHWRATTKQSAIDVAKLVITKIKNQTLENTPDGRYHIAIIAEQPYPVRMAKQIQREFDKEIKRAGQDEKIAVTVEGCGPGVAEQEIDVAELGRLDSELGALMAERFYNARLTQMHVELRDPGIIMFANRDKKFMELQVGAEYKLETPKLQ